MGEDMHKTYDVLVDKCKFGLKTVLPANAHRGDINKERRDIADRYDISPSGITFVRVK